MSIEQAWGKFFKAETRTSGEKLFSQEKVSVSSANDTSVQAFIRVAPPFRVQFSADDIGSPSFTADCNCPAAKKGRLCKHIWATLLAVGEKHPDFLSSKRSIEKSALALDEMTPPENTYAETAKARASAYAKEQYQKQKAYAKEKKQGAKEKKSGGLGLRSSSPEMDSALAYFALNGFPMKDGPSEEVLTEAKRKLSRIFHPDKGGSHDEIVELNTHWEVLSLFLRG